jgi:hypothetical protein
MSDGGLYLRANEPAGQDKYAQTCPYSQRGIQASNRKWFFTGNHQVDETIPLQIPDPISKGP